MITWNFSDIVCLIDLDAFVSAVLLIVNASSSLTIYHASTKRVTAAPNVAFFLVPSQVYLCPSTLVICGPQNEGLFVGHSASSNPAPPVSFYNWRYLHQLCIRLLSVNVRIFTSPQVGWPSYVRSSQELWPASYAFIVYARFQKNHLLSSLFLFYHVECLIKRFILNQKMDLNLF